METSVAPRRERGCIVVFLEGASARTRNVTEYTCTFGACNLFVQGSEGHEVCCGHTIRLRRESRNEAKRVFDGHDVAPHALSTNTQRGRDKLLEAKRDPEGRASSSSS